MPLILVVDDAPLCREPIAARLRLEGFKTICASNGQEALALIEKHSPDLVLMDVAMPIMDGITTLRKIRENPATSSLPVFVLTAITERSYIETLEPLQPSHILFKSHFSLPDLVAHVHKHLQGGIAA
jgi:CheY-like chemotaxis protein